jgi:hypothetical protein
MYDLLKRIVEKWHSSNTIHQIRFRFMVFNATFNNISAISWWSVLLVEETRVPEENHRPVASHLSHNVGSSTPRHVQYS